PVRRSRRARPSGARPSRPCGTAPRSRPQRLDRETAVHDDGEPRIVRDLPGLATGDPELEPEAAGADLDRLAGVVGARRWEPEDVDEVERPGRLDRLAQRRVAAKTGDLVGGGIHRDDVVAEADEVAQNAVRR